MGWLIPGILREDILLFLSGGIFAGAATLFRRIFTFGGTVTFGERSGRSLSHDLEPHILPSCPPMIDRDDSVNLVALLIGICQKCTCIIHPGAHRC